MPNATGGMKTALPALFRVTGVGAKPLRLSENVTVPAGVAPVAVSVAVKVTDWPKTEGFGAEPKVIEVARGGLTTWVTVAGPLAAKLVVGTNVALIVWLLME